MSQNVISRCVGMRYRLLFVQVVAYQRVYVQNQLNRWNLKPSESSLGKDKLLRINSNDKPFLDMASCEDWKYYIKQYHIILLILYVPFTVR